MGKKRRKPITTYRNRTQKESSGNHAGISNHVGIGGFAADAIRDNTASNKNEESTFEGGNKNKVSLHSDFTGFHTDKGEHDFSVEVGKQDFSDSKSNVGFSTETERTQGKQELAERQAESLTQVDSAGKSAEKRSRERNVRNVQSNSDYRDEEIRAQRDDVFQDNLITEKDSWDNSRIVKEVQSETVRPSDYRWNGGYHL